MVRCSTPSTCYTLTYIMQWIGTRLHHGTDVTQVLAYIAQAAHELVPPDALESTVLKISYNFVSEKSMPPVMAVGYVAKMLTMP